jgi:hypothetical protein
VRAATAESEWEYSVLGGLISSVVQPDNVVLYFIRREAGKKFQQSFYDDSDRQLLGKENAAMMTTGGHELIVEFDEISYIEGKQNPLLQ